jgi:hypothetical protein
LHEQLSDLIRLVPKVSKFLIHHPAMRRIANASNNDITNLSFGMNTNDEDGAGGSHSKRTIFEIVNIKKKSPSSQLH